MFSSVPVLSDNVDYKISKRIKMIKGAEGCILNTKLTFLIERSCYLARAGERGDRKRQAIMGSTSPFIKSPFSTNPQNDVPTNVTQKAISAHPALTDK